jgi:hypothetical protein
MYNWNPDPGLICRDDDCELNEDGIHPKHSQRRKRPPEVHHRPKPGGVLKIWQYADPPGVAESVEKATSADRPKVIWEIVRDVQDDYGSVTERTIYRHVRALVDAGRLIKLGNGGGGRAGSINLRLPFAAYIKARSRLLADPDNLRDYMLGTYELHPATKKSRHA